MGVICSTNLWNFDVFCFGVVGCDPFQEQANQSVFCEIFSYMSYPGSEDAVGSNLKGNPSDMDDRRRLDSPSDQREDNVTATWTADRCAGVSSLQVPVMAAPNVLESLQECIKQGPILREIQRGMTDLCSRVGDLERKRGRSSSCDRNTSETNIISKKRKLLENESESDADSDIEVSNQETHHIPDTQQPSTSKEFDNILSDGELASEDESDDDILKEFKLVFKGTEKSGPAIDKGLTDVVNEGLRSVGQSEEVKKLQEKFIRPTNVDNLQVPKVEPIIWRNLSDKGKATDAAVQKAVSKFMPGLTAIVQQLELINKHKKEPKKISVFKEIKKLSTETVSALSHAVSVSCQQRKDAIKSELDSKFHSLCEPAHLASATQLFRDNLNAELKELDDSKKVHVSIA